MAIQINELIIRADISDQEENKARISEIEKERFLEEVRTIVDRSTNVNRNER